MRKIYSLVVMAFIALMICSCSDTATYTNVIPADAAVVISINTNSLLEKADADSDGELKDMLLESAKKEVSAPMYSLLEDITADINSCGIDFEYPLYCTSEGSDFSQVLFIAKIGDIENFEKTLSVLKEEGVCGDTYPDYGTFKYCVGGNEDAVIAYKDDVLIMTSIPYRSTSEEVLENVIAELMVQKAEQSVNSQDGFKAMVKEGSDFGLYASADAILANNEFKQFSKFSSVESLKNSYVYGGLDFEQGHISLYMQVASSDGSYEKELEKQMAMYEKIDGKFLKFISDEAVGAVTLGFDGEKVYDSIVVMQESDKEFAKMLPAAQLALVKPIITAFKGEMTFAAVDEQNYLAYMNIASKESALELLSLIENEAGMKVKEVEEGEYLIDMRFLKIYISIDGDVMYITNSEALYAKLDEKAENSIGDVEFVNELSDKVTFAYVDINSKPIREMLRRDIQREPAIGIALNEVKQIEFSVSDKMRIETDLVLKESDENSLKYLVEMFSKVAAGYVK